MMCSTALHPAQTSERIGSGSVWTTTKDLARPTPFWTTLFRPHVSAPLAEQALRRSRP